MWDLRDRSVTMARAVVNSKGYHETVAFVAFTASAVGTIAWATFQVARVVREIKR